MKNQPIITVKNISKKYNIRHQQGGYVALRDVLTNIFRNPFSFIKSKTKEALGIDTKEEFWALKDINFEIMKGEVIGIIGRNGAGKSTLLKILSQITPPTTGEIKIHGTVGSLLEVGTGFHPELTGRENIFLNGAILGMKKKEIVKKFDDIVEFAGVEKFLDTPVKYYSSGMYVRLAFSVAAHMDPDILIVDEVLAVGDAEFQKKCLGKMESITKEEGRTIIFVSHDMDAIANICTKCILLSRGKLQKFGNTKDIIDLYRSNKLDVVENNVAEDFNILKNQSTKNGTKFTSIQILNLQNNILKSNEPIKVLLKYSSENNDLIKNPRIVITITNDISKNVVLRLDSDVTKDSLSYGIPHAGEILCETKDCINLIDGRYSMDVDFLIDGVSVNHLSGIRKFEVETDLKYYNYKNYPDKNVCDTVIKYQFKQNNEDEKN